MKKKMSLLLIFAMVVTMTITMPFGSFATETTPTGTIKITKLYGATSSVKAVPVVDTEAKTATSTYKYTPSWDIDAEFAGAAVTGIETTPQVAVKYTEGSTEKTVTADSGVYSLQRGVEYTITLTYTLNETVTTLAEITLNANAHVDSNYSAGTSQSITTKNKEFWYSASADAQNKGMLFSLRSGASGDTATTKINYVAKVYEGTGTTAIGSAEWNDDYGMMFDCPLVLKKDTTYYVQVVPTAATTAESVNIAFSTTRIPAGEVDVYSDTQVELKPAETPTELTLYNYKNAEDGVHWYYIVPSGNKKTYEINIDFGEDQYGECGVELVSARKMDNIIDDGYAYAGSDSNKFYAELAAEKYYLKLTPLFETPRVDIKVTVKEHTCTPTWYVSDSDYNEISYGCLCGSDSSLVGSCVVTPKFKNAVYTGAAVTPELNFTFTNWVAEDGKTEMPACDFTGCYTITEYKYNKKTYSSINNSIGKSIGEYSATVRFINNLDGLDDVNKTVQIVPAATALTKVTAGKKAFTAKWTTSTKVTGYQLQYGLKDTFKGAKTTTITKKSTGSKKISKLKAKKTYYVRVRAYKTGKNAKGKSVKYYSAWSDPMTVITKK